MSAPILAFFNNKGGVGKASLVYHLAWMYAELGKTVVVVDLNPQTKLTEAFLEEGALADLLDNDESGTTAYQCLRPLSGSGDIKDAVLNNIEEVEEKIWLLPGDIALGELEDMFARNWSIALSGGNSYRPMKVLSSIRRLMAAAAKRVEADIVLVDTDANLGAINRLAMVTADYVAIPLDSDMMSMQGLKSLGPTIRRWSSDWQKCLANWNECDDYTKHPELIPHLNSQSEIIGYLMKMPNNRMKRPVRLDDKWARKIPGIYRQFVLDQKNKSPAYQEDPNCLDLIKHYRSITPLGQEHRKPIFMLTPADDAFGSHALAVQDAKKDYRALAHKIAEKIGLPLP